MGIFDTITSMASQLSGGDHSAVGGGLMQELQQQPGGISSIFQSFQQNGLGGLVQQWAGGQTGPANPDQIEQGLAGTGIIDNIAAKTGMSPTIVKMALAALVPIVVHHFVANGHVTETGEPTGAPPPDSASVLQSVLGKL
jgi:uncharacterized protein YidB (DUF937 family)